MCTDQQKVTLSRTKKVEMTPGDVLFIPRAEPHSAAVSTKHSVHLTISLISQIGINFFRHLRKEAAKDPLLRMGLPRHSSDEKARAHEAALKHQLHQLIDAASMSQFLREGDLSRSPALQTDWNSVFLCASHAGASSASATRWLDSRVILI
jgi:ribosomal protein L16 Arg81 hydroxylase